ncbi:MULTISPECIES: sugar phosphate isomerase/epimerase family protein [Robiginitalea]|nr:MULTISPECIES: sugar phosphate isomerase/epimerase family protein [Robiginitalea]MDC6354846.1 sugar phosphate isomerase/epimerase [Robiginitalea sp. PM2]MDC6375112.1 sugar phosphate isomerase/epimerase [Robiginitalea sp. SP8]
MERRTFLKRTATTGIALSMPVFPSFLTAGSDNRFGVAEAGYYMRWYRDLPSTAFPPFESALEMMDHCHALGFGGVQVNVRGWDREMVREVRNRQESLGMFVEGQIRLPRDDADADRFEKEIRAGKDAGVRIFRTVCLSGRRYENFSDLESFEKFRRESREAIRRAEPIAAKHRVKLAVENHKDWRAGEMLNLLSEFDSEWIGVTLDTGNNIALLERPMEVVDALAPYTFSVHLKDMGVEEYPDGFLLSEVPLGEGYLDLQGMINRIRKENPSVRFNLEMITRDPLEVPCLTPGYWATFNQIGPAELAEFLHHIREHDTGQPLPRVSGFSDDVQLALEVANNRESLVKARELYGFS